MTQNADSNGEKESSENAVVAHEQPISTQTTDKKTDASTNDSAAKTAPIAVECQNEEDENDSFNDNFSGDSTPYDSYSIEKEGSNKESNKPTIQEPVSAPFPTDDAELIEQARLLVEDNTFYDTASSARLDKYKLVQGSQTDLSNVANISSDSSDAARTQRLAEISANTAHTVNECSSCQAPIETWEIECHSCGLSLGKEALVLPENTSSSNAQMSDATTKQLAEAFDEWFERGKSALTQGNLGEAQDDLRQALLRAPSQKELNSEVVQARELLAQVLLKLGKADEATIEYAHLAHDAVNRDAKMRFEGLAKKAGGESSINVASARSVRNSDGSAQALFCGLCRRPLLESEVYAYKRSKGSFRCVCGFEGSPLTYATSESSKHLKAIAAKQRALLIAAASPVVENGRKKPLSILLACSLGFIGAHKFYLGEYLIGSLYLTLCWTLIPAAMSLLDAIQLAHMSRVSFNLTYNLESILERLPEDKDFAGQTHSDLLSMQLGEDVLESEAGSSVDPLRQ